MDNLFSLQDKVALVTGASQGLGAEMAKSLARAGAHVILVARNSEKLEKKAKEISNDGGHASPYVLDITNEEAVCRAVTEINSEHGTVDILVNNAGIIERVGLTDSTTEGFKAVLETNVTASYVLSREFAKAMLKNQYGRIVNIGSILSLVGRSSVHAYTVSKHAISGLTQALASDLGPSGINVNAILPGYFKTEINVVLQENQPFDQMVRTRTPLARWGEAKELAGPLTFLCSEASSYVNGHLLVVDGGFTSTIQGP